MMKRLKIEKMEPWIILGPAAAVTMIHIVLLHLYGVTEWGSHRYAWNAISDGLLDCLIVYTMLCAWRLRSTNLPHALLLGTVAMLAFYLSFFNYIYNIDDGVEFVHRILALTAPFLLWSIMYRLRERMEKKKAVICGVIWGLVVLAITVMAAAVDNSLDWLFDYLIPAAVIILEGCACIWVSALKFQDEQERKKWLWRAWLGSLVLAYIYTTDDDVELLHGILALAAPFLLWSIMYRFREKKEKKKASVICGVIWGLAVLAITVMAAAFDDSLAWLVDYLFPAVVIILEGCACIWVSALEFQDEQERKKWLWRAWLGGIVFAVLVNNLFTKDLFVFLSDSCWGQAAYAAMPILYAMVFRLLMRRKWHDALKYVLYYAFCLFTKRIYFYGLIGLVMPILICMVESRDSNQKSRWLPVASTLYAAAWAIRSFFWNSRLREIFFDLGGPAVNIQLTERVDWLGYRLAAVKSYRAGNTYAFMEYFLRNGKPLDYWEDQGYHLFYSDEFLGALTFRFGQLWLVIMVVLVIIVAALLLKKNMSLPQTMHRNRQYMGISYLIRAAVSCVYIVTMMRWSGEDFPFNAEMLMDLLVLWVLVKGEDKCLSISLD